MTDRYLRTGIFLAPFHALDENPTLAIERDMELVQHLDRLNYHEAWIGEHHSGGFEIIASPEMFIAAAAERTRHIRLGTGVVSLPYHNPFMLASRMTQLDHMTRGRAMFGVGPGALVHDAAKIGIKAAEQRDRMNESLDVIVELMEGKSVTRKTDWFDLTAAQLQLPSYSQPGMEMAVACARSPVGAVLLLAHNWADWPATQRSYELMARYVHPHFQRQSNMPRQQSYDIATSNRGIYSVQSQAAVTTEIEKYQAAQSKRAAE
ncbi:MAG TPA: LLM class flavin-dependent oxidoreductase [Reyranella sp.]